MGEAAFINPLSTETKLNGFMGNLIVEGNNVYRVPSDNSIFTGITPKAAFNAASALRDWIILKLPSATTANPLIIGTHSQGGQFALLCLRMFGNEIQTALTSLGKTAEVLQFYLAGCPEAPYTGAGYLFPTLDVPKYPGNEPHTSDCPIPAIYHGGWGVGYGINITAGAVPWHITFVINEWDGWAHCPVGYASVPSMDEEISFLGIVIRHPWFKPGRILAKMRGNYGYHSGNNHYRQSPLDPAVPKQAYNIPGTNMKCVYIMKYPMPYAIPQQHIRYKARAIDVKMRPIWAAAYSNMPGATGIQTPDYANLPSLVPWRPTT